MNNKGFNPLFLSALDILTGALGVFIVLNFLNTRTPANPPTKAMAEVEKSKKETPPPPARNNNLPGNGQRYQSPTYAASEPGTRQQPGAVTPPPTPANPATSQPEAPKPETESDQPTAASKDPVAVDLMKQTRGAVAILLQQADASKTSVEMMLRQGGRTWKPTRSSKYQDEIFQYDRRLGYFFQPNVTPGNYEVLVRAKRSARGSMPFSLYGKMILANQKAQTYNFGTFAAPGGDEWISAGTVTIGSGGLTFTPRLNKVDPSAVTPSADNSPTPSAPPAEKATKKRSGKWG